MATYLNRIPKDEWTLWEREYNRKRPYHFYKIRDEWTATERDFIAYWNGQLQDLLDELGHPSAKPIMEINRWMRPIVEDGADTDNMTREQWFEYSIATLEAFEKLSWTDMEALRKSGVAYHEKYDNAVATRWESMSQDERDAARGMTDEQKADRDAFESMTPEERAEHERAVRVSGGGVRSTRNHVDGRIIDEHGQTVGRWKELEGTILDKVKGWAAETHHGDEHVRRWQEAANGIQPGTFPEAGIMSAKEASENAVRFMKSRWSPTARAIRDREIGFDSGQTNVGSEKELRASQPLVAPEHKQAFLEWLVIERDVEEKNNGAGSVIIKHRVFEKLIEQVEQDVAVGGGGLQAQYDNFLGWLRGDYGQLTIHDTIRMSTPSKDGTVTDAMDGSAPPTQERRGYEQPSPSRVRKVPAGLIKTVRGYYMANKNKKSRGENWLRVLIAFGVAAHETLTPYTAEEARNSEKVWSGWRPVRIALEDLERGDDSAQSSSDYKAEQDAYAEEVERFQAARDNGDPDAQLGFDEWKRRESGTLFPFNGTYVEDARTGCLIAFDKVASRRDELTAENVRYRLDCDRPDGIRQISWLALNYEGCLCWLPHYDKEKAEKTRMIPAEEVPDLIWSGWRVLTKEEYAENQRVHHSRDDKFSAFKLWVQHSPNDTPLGVCPTQANSGKWEHNEELFSRLREHVAL